MDLRELLNHPIFLLAVAAAAASDAFAHSAYFAGGAIILGGMYEASELIAFNAMMQHDPNCPCGTGGDGHDPDKDDDKETSQ
jgi:hypothetical protein